jgi:outer membrane lipoprotein carrier protein
MKAATILGTALISLSFLLTSFQKDSKATEILNLLSAKTKAYKTITADFTYAVKSQEVEEKEKGTLKIKGDQYKYHIFGVTKVSDGKKICTISDADEEVIITNVNFDDADEFSPSEIFTIYQNGYKYRYIKETSLNNKTVHVIELYPETDKNNPYRRITMFINKSEIALSKIELYPKASAKVFSISIDNAKFNEVIADTQFSCGCGIKKDYDCDDQTGAK